MRSLRKIKVRNPVEVVPHHPDQPAADSTFKSRLESCSPTKYQKFCAVMAERKESGTELPSSREMVELLGISLKTVYKLRDRAIMEKIVPYDLWRDVGTGKRKPYSDDAFRRDTQRLRALVTELRKEFYPLSESHPGKLEVKALLETCMTSVEDMIEKLKGNK